MKMSSASQPDILRTSDSADAAEVFRLNIQSHKIAPNRYKLTWIWNRLYPRYKVVVENMFESTPESIASIDFDTFRNGDGYYFQCDHPVAVQIIPELVKDTPDPAESGRVLILDQKYLIYYAVNNRNHNKVRLVIDTARSPVLKYLQDGDILYQIEDTRNDTLHNTQYLPLIHGDEEYELFALQRGQTLCLTINRDKQIEKLNYCYYRDFILLVNQKETG